jgi:hypothetical protein
MNSGALFENAAAILLQSVHQSTELVNQLREVLPCAKPRRSEQEYPLAAYNIRQPTT